MSDIGLSHVALPARDLAASVDFYQRFAGMHIVHDRVDPAGKNRVVWLSDGVRPFALVLIETPDVRHPLLPIAHLGVGCASKQEVDRLVALARAEGRKVRGPSDSGYPVGYWALIEDPDRHTLEISHGQEVGKATGAGEKAVRDADR